MWPTFWATNELELKDSQTRCLAVSATHVATPACGSSLSGARDPRPSRFSRHPSRLLAHPHGRLRRSIQHLPHVNLPRAMHIESKMRVALMRAQEMGAAGGLYLSHYHRVRRKGREDCVVRGQTLIQRHRRRWPNVRHPSCLFFLDRSVTRVRASAPQLGG